MNRRGFFSVLAGMAATATLDPERLLWVPGKKLISIPKPIPETWGAGLQFFTEFPERINGLHTVGESLFAMTEGGLYRIHPTGLFEKIASVIGPAVTCEPVPARWELFPNPWR